MRRLTSFVVIILFAAACAHGPDLIRAEKPGNIIVIMGTPSAGKTTFAKELQKQLKEPHLLLSTDVFSHALRPDLVENEPIHRKGLYFVREERAHGTVTKMHFGPLGEQLVDAVVNTVAGIALAGNNLILEGVIWEKSHVERFSKYLSDFNVYGVLLSTPLSTALERESKRKGWYENRERIKGQVEGAFEAIKSFGDVFDMRIDTSSIGLEKAAAKLIAYLNRNNGRGLRP